MTRKKSGKLYIGTSGWVYPHWQDIFYPKNLAPKDKLKYFSRHFKTAEINFSFYHLPLSKTYQKWYRETPADFLFAVKASRFITHIKRLKRVKMAWKTFLENSLHLKEKLGPILFQFPSNFKADKENIKRLKDFLKILQSSSQKDLKFAFEFRHSSWCNQKIYNLLKKYRAAWVIADSPRYPRAEVVTTNFVYIRMHGGKTLYSSNYSIKELKEWAKKIKKYANQSLNVYVYFNNDAKGYALKNAKTLKDFLKNY
jgi:uncharacterized protein YecE (DUF72 family)